MLFMCSRWGPKWLLWVALAWPLWAGAWASYPPLQIEQAWVEDHGGQMDWAAAQRSTLTPYTGVLSRGYSNSPLWIRVRIVPSTQLRYVTDHLYVRLRPMHLEDVVLYDSMQIPAQRPPMGDLHPVTGSSLPSTTYLQRIPLGHGPRELWLHVRSSSARLVQAEVLTPVELRSSELHINQLSAVYIAVMGLLLLGGALQWVSRPDWRMASFLGWQGVSVLQAGVLLGYAYWYLSVYLPPSSLHWLVNILTLLGLLCHTTFAHMLLRDLGPTPWSLRLIGLLMALSLLLLALMFWDHDRIALQAHSWLSMLVPLVLFALAWRAPGQLPTERRSQRRALSRPVLLLYLGLVGLLLAWPQWVTQGWWVFNGFTLYVGQVATLGVSLLMVLVLQYRAWLQARNFTQLRNLAHESSFKAEKELVHRKEIERMLAMLGHELRTPLAAMRMMLADRDMGDEWRLRMRRSVNEMNQVLERAVQSGQLEAGSIVCNLGPVDLAQLLADVLAELDAQQRVALHLSQSGPVWVQTDPMLLRMVLRNLLDNALKYSPPASPVQLDVTAPDDSGAWQLRVINRVGRAGQPDAAQMFTKYYRSPLAGHRSGSGLGMFLAEGLARSLGGQLTYQPMDGHVQFTLSMGKPAGDTN